jgi:hypothetical protein
MSLFLVRMVEKLLGHALRVNAPRHEVVAPVAQDAHELRRQRIVQQLEHDLAVRGIAGGDRAFIDVLPGALAQRRDVGKKRILRHGVVPFPLQAPINSRTSRITTMTPTIPLGP